MKEWDQMSLSELMEDRQDESQTAAIRSITARLMNHQYDPRKDYHTYLYLYDRLLSAVDIPDIKKQLRDRTPRTFLQLNNRVSNRLNTGKGSSGLEEELTSDASPSDNT